MLTRRFPASGWVPAQFDRGWVLAEQTCIARGSPVHPKLGCVEMPFHCGIARGSLRLTPLACLEMLSPLGVRQADGLLRARHGVDLLADEEIQGRIYSIEVPARAPVGSQDEELAQGDVMALADEPTWRLPASGWAVFH